MLAVIKEQIIGILQQLNAMAIDHGLNPITFILATILSVYYYILTKKERV